MTPQTLLAAIDADAPLAQRHLWLMDTLRWVRGDAADVIGAVARMRALLDALDADPALGPRGRARWDTVHQTLDNTPRLGAHGGAPLHILRPVGLDPFGHEEVGRQRCPAALGHFGHTLGKRRHRRAHDRRVRQLEGLHDHALAVLHRHRVFHRHVPVLAFDVVRRLRRPDLEHRVDALDKHGVAVIIQIAEHFRVRDQPARADAHDEAALEHMVQHGHVGGNGGRVTVGHVDGARAQLDLVRVKSQAAQEHQAGRDVFSQVGDMLAHISFAETQAVGQNNGLTVFEQRFAGNARRWMQWHHECTELHGSSSLLCGQV